jgi:predicted Zn-dependent protease
MKKYTFTVFLALCVFTSCESLPQILGDAARKLGVSGDMVDTIENVADKVGTFADSVKAANSLTPENEYYLGRAVAANIASKYKVYTGNPALVSYLNKICNTLVINSPRPDIYKGYHVAILDTQEINAFATPGGHIFVTRGLIACSPNEDALASVIAHEIAHIQLRHALTSIRNAKYLNAAVSGILAGIGENSSTVKELSGIMGDSVNEVINTMVSNGFSKSQELEADTTALSLLASAGYQPSSILDMLRALQQQTQAGQGFSKTHPSPADRITNVNKSLRKYSVADTRSFREPRYTTAVR